MKISMFGIKGLPLPAGAEVVVEEISKRLVERGHEVSVYVRSHYTSKELKEYLEMKLIHLPSIPSKNLDAITHSFLSSMHVLGHKPDVLHIHSTGNSVFSLHPRAFGIPTVVTSHGLDWQRAKWGLLAKTFLRLTDYTTTYFPNAVTAVSRKMQRYYHGVSGREIAYIPNGVNPPQKFPPGEIKKLGLKGGDYILFAARFVPEKGAHYLIEAFNQLDHPKLKLVMAGDGAYGDKYAEGLKKFSSQRVIFPGFVSGQLKAELLSNAYLFVLPSEIEGLSTGLLEAMSYGNCVLVSDIEENLEVIGDAGLTFKSGSVDDLRSKLQHLVGHPLDVKKVGLKAGEIVDRQFNWDVITDMYEKLYMQVQ